MVFELIVPNAIVGEVLTVIVVVKLPEPELIHPKEFVPLMV